jgi:hypothetical protein
VKCSFKEAAEFHRLNYFKINPVPFDEYISELLDALYQNQPDPSFDKLDNHRKNPRLYNNRGKYLESDIS